MHNQNFSSKLGEVPEGRRGLSIMTDIPLIGLLLYHCLVFTTIGIVYFTSTFLPFKI